jgi:hypothetical protein
MKKKLFKLYVNECIEQHFIEHLRKGHNIDIKSAAEEGFKGKSDEEILKCANELKRFLLTCARGPMFIRLSLVISARVLVVI